MLHALIADCIENEKTFGLGEASLEELKRYLGGFADFCDEHLKRICELSPLFLKDYVDFRCKDTGPSVMKALVWSLRKFGSFLNLRQMLPENPAKPLQHPKFPLRKELPVYLSTDDLRKLLTSAAKKGNQRDFAILSLITGTGLRPGDIARIKRSDFDVTSQCIKGIVKGYWTKTTPLNTHLASLLVDYLSSRSDEEKSLFLTDRRKAVTVSWIQRMVKMAAREAQLEVPVTCNILRHTFATYAADRHGQTITRTLLGHQRMKTTAVYTHRSPRRYRPLMNRHPYVTTIRVLGEIHHG